MDTVEWGSVDAGQRRLPRRLSTPYVGALVLAGIGFAVLMGAELNPWASEQSLGANGQSAGQLSIGLEVLGSAPGITYHLGALALLGTVGLVLAAPARRRRTPLGLAVGVAAGQLLIVVQVIQVLQRTLDGSVPGQTPGADTVITVSPSSLRTGVYLSIGGVLLLVAAVVLAAVPWRELTMGAPIVAAEAAPPEEDVRDLTVTALEPLDESHFARE